MLERVKNLRNNLQIVDLEGIIPQEDISQNGFNPAFLGYKIPKSNSKRNKYEYTFPKINKILTCLLTDEVIKRYKIFDKSMDLITKNLVPVRPNRSSVQESF